MLDYLDVVLLGLLAPLLVQLSDTLLLLLGLDLRQLCDIVHKLEHSGYVITCLELVRLVLVLERVELVYHYAKLILDIFLHFLYLLLKYLLDEFLNSCRDVNTLVLQLQVCEGVRELFALLL